MRKKAIIWGTVGAIVVRAVMTLVAVWLLMVPGLRFLGGLALVGIAYKLLVPRQRDDGAYGKPADNFWSAMKTIVVADALMGLDSVLAVAGAAKGNFLLVALGLLFSRPIAAWGSTLILQWVDRLAVIVYIGAAVLAWTAAQMMLHEPMLTPHLHDLLKAAVYLVAIVGVLFAGFLADPGQRRAIVESARERL